MTEKLMKKPIEEEDQGKIRFGESVESIGGYSFTTMESKILRELLPEDKEPEKLISIVEDFVQSVSGDFSEVNGFLDSRPNGGDSLIEIRAGLGNISLMAFLRKKITPELPEAS